MLLEDILKLPLTKDSMEVIDSFLKTATKNDKSEGLLKKAQVLTSLNQEEDAMRVLMGLFHDEKLNRDLQIKIINEIIFVYAKTENYDLAIKFIHKKREKLPVYELYRANYDLADIYYQMGKKPEAIIEYEMLLKDDLADDERVKIYKNLIEIYLGDSNYDYALKYVKYLKEFTSGVDENNYFYAVYYEAYVLYMLKEYKTSYGFNKECINNQMFIEENLLLKAYVLNIKILVALKEYKKAIINEAEYESIIMKADVYLQNDFFDACISLYESLGNKLSMTTYQERKKALKFPKKVKKTFQEHKEIKVSVAPTKTYKADRKGIYYVIENIIKLYNTTLNQPITPKFRDILLPLFIEAANLAHFDECVLVLVENGYSGYHYKKERLYDKNFEDIRLTVPYEVLANNREMMYSSNEELKGLKDLIKNDNYEYGDVKALMAFPLYRNKAIIGVVYFYSFSENVLLGFNYELLKYTTILINDRLINIAAIRELKLDKQAYFEAFEYADVPLKYVLEDVIYCNKKTREFLRIDAKVSFKEYLSGVSVNDYQRYRDFLGNSDEEIKYCYNDLNIMEKRIVINEDCSVSILSDISQDVIDASKEEKRTYNDFLTGLGNMYAYYEDIGPLIREEKFSMLLLDVNGFNKINDCYGFDFGNSILRLVSHYLKTFFEDYNVRLYHLEGDKFLINIKGINDARSIMKIGKELVEYLRVHVNKKSARLEITFKVGALRYKVQTTEKDSWKLIEYVRYALKMAKDEGFSYFDADEYRNNFQINAMAAHINEAIDLSKIGINYRKVVDIKQHVIAFYEAKPHMFDVTISTNEIMRIVALRGLTNKFERFMIKRVLLEILDFHAKQKKYFKVAVQVNYDTILKPEFLPFMQKVLQDNKMPKGIIVLELIGERKDLSKQINPLRELGILFMTSYIEDVLLFKADYFKVSYLLKHLKNPNGVSTTKGLVKLCQELGIKLMLTKIKNTDLSQLSALEVDLASYGDIITLKEIMNNIKGA